jgi:spermidine/putrescine transport system permease protein
VRSGRGDAVGEPRGLILPAWAYYVGFFVAPLLFIVAFAFAHREGFFDITWFSSTENFRKLWDPVYLKIYGNTLLLAFQGTVGCLLIGYPFAYWIATRVRDRKTLVLLLVIVPFWTSILIRTYAWALILAPSGFVSNGLQDLGLIGSPLHLLGTNTAVLIGVVYDYLPLMVFPLYVSIERVDRRLVEASRDLGRGRWATFWRVTAPLTLPGILTGCLLVFVPMTGEYVVPSILGGGLQGLFGPVAADQFLDAFNYPFGAAMSLVLVVFLLALIFVYLRVLGRQAERTAGVTL